MNEGDFALTDSRIRLRDGRTLAYAEYGAPGGLPVMLFHGSPGGRLLHPKSIMAGAAGTRVISVERPGYGYSDLSSEGGMLEWADDVAELADALGIERFAVVGPSGGGPYAAACAYRLPARITAAGLVSSPAPLPVDRHGAGQTSSSTAGFSEVTVAAAREMSFLDFLPWALERWASTPEDFGQLLESMKETMPECDRRVLELPEVEESFRRGGPEAFRQGWKGYARDAWLQLRPWGFLLEDIAVPTYLWHGELDKTVEVEEGRYLAGAIPNCQATYYADKGHMLPPECWEDIYGALVGRLNPV